VPVLKKGVQFLKQRIINNSFSDVSPKTEKCSVHNNRNRYRSASLTTEAALAFPLFFFTVYLLWQLFLLVLFQMEVCHEMTATAIRYAHLGYPQRKAEEQTVDISWLYQPLLWNALPESERVEHLWVLCSAQEDGTIQAEVHYQFACEAVFFTEFTIPVQQTFRFYPYLGRTDADRFAAEDATKKDIVYMTEYGTVYHESRACTYLNVVVRAVAAADVEAERNSFGRKYTLCERCDDRQATGTVYLSDGGTKYHLVAACPALKRTVMEKERSEVEGIPACHKCGKTEDKEE